MRRLIAALVIAASLFSSTPAHAWWHHRHCGWRGGWGGHCAWNSWGCRRWGGYGGYGGCGYVAYPSCGYSVGYYPAYSYGYRNYGYRPYTVASPYVYSPARTVISTTAALPRATPNYSNVQANVQTNPSPVTVQNFLGMNELKAIEQRAPVVANLLARFVGQRAAQPVAAPRIANADTRQSAQRQIALGDSLFRAQNFQSALQHYKSAVALAPDDAEAQWRQGHALVATHNYDLATAAFKRAIALQDDVRRGGFRLSDLYGSAELTKTAHLESLAEYALTREQSSEPYFLLGVFLTYDGQEPRAEKFFSRASDLAGISGGHIDAFLGEDAEVPVIASRPVVRESVKPATKEVATGTAREI